MAEFDYQQRKQTPEWEVNAERLYGKRCKKHATQRLPCKRCQELKEQAND